MQTQLSRRASQPPPFSFMEHFSLQRFSSAFAPMQLITPPLPAEPRSPRRIDPASIEALIPPGDALLQLLQATVYRHPDHR
jgi:hypothetical protein